MDKRAWIAIVVFFLGFLAWQKFFGELKGNAPTGSAPPQAATGLSKSVATVVPASSAPVRPEGRAALRTSNGEASVANDMRLFSDWVAGAFRESGSSDPVRFSKVFGESASSEILFDDPRFLDLTGQRGDLIHGDGVAKSVFEDARIRVAREYRASGDSPWTEVTLRIDFKGSDRPGNLFLTATNASPEGDLEEAQRELLFWADKKIQRIPVAKDVETRAWTGSVKWVGAASRYFVYALVRAGQESGVGEPKALTQPTGPRAARVGLSYPILAQSVVIPLRVYFGAKEIEVIRSVDPTLDHAVDFGFFTFFAYPILSALRWLNRLFSNYGLAIIALTLSLKVVLFPLTYKSAKSTKEMAKIQPQIQKIREKHKDDKEALNREMISLMKSHGYNPMAGCWPILVQMPIFIALYNVLNGAVELYQAPFAFWIRDLSLKDPFYVTPIILTAVMYIQQKLTPTPAADPVQAKMLQFMPLIFGLMMITLPSGLTLYMLVNAIASIAQQMVLNKRLGITPSRLVPAGSVPK